MVFIMFVGYFFASTSVGKFEVNDCGDISFLKQTDQLLKKLTFSFFKSKASIKADFVRL